MLHMTAAIRFMAHCVWYVLINLSVKITQGICILGITNCSVLFYLVKKYNFKVLLCLILTCYTVGEFTMEKKERMCLLPTSCEFPRALCAPHGNHDLGGACGEGVRPGWVSGNCF